MLQSLLKLSGVTNTKNTTLTTDSYIYTIIDRHALRYLKQRERQLKAPPQKGGIYKAPGKKHVLNFISASRDQVLNQ